MEVSFTAVILVVIFGPVFSNDSKRDHVCGRPIGTEFRLEEDRIVAGYDIGYYRYPWYAALIRYDTVSCGAALIGPKTVLTAAHCYKEFLDLASKGFLRLESIYTVKLGIYNICTTESTQREFTIEKVYIHEGYYKNRPYYDLSLLTLQGDTSAYMPICLPQYEINKMPPDGTVPGLGTLKYHGAMPCTVHEARLLVYNNSECVRMINSTGNDAKAIKNAFCAGYIQGGIDTCQGDSGGPLQSMNSDGDYVLLGIVSFGFRCALPGLLGMYTDVSKYLDWIQEKSGLDAGIVNLIYNKTVASKPTLNGTGTGNPNSSLGHHRKPHFGKPFRRPVRVIVYKNNRYHVTTKPLLHHPLIRNN
ncbi:unnamed protein product [Phaedon cochleariae]|uniref:Peptidase S1 domain-containing protein n=1 Tax=Phaedon cochleariae TaxID=80249 RepID=A0A9P0DFC0_PHACE|nr:unnamed protein product [Phaedon cochleariae]